MTFLSRYQEVSATTDQVDSTDTLQSTIYLLGVLGEYGTLLSEIKKYRRDGDAYTGFTEHVSEELGDVLWYLVAVARKLGVDIARIDGQKEVVARDLDPALFSLGGHLSRLVSQFNSDAVERLELEKSISNALGEMRTISIYLGLELEDVAEANIRKITDRWHRLPGTAACCYDGTMPMEERMPRQATIKFIQRTKGDGASVILQSKGINVGDRLTDNAREDDGYRFHDAFHFANAAILGWSPVTRALFRCKRKSDPKTDEVEDGARAQIVEECISLQVFSYARERSYLKGLGSVDQDLLQRIKPMVKGLEVARRSTWEWEVAIIRGYEVFRSLREHQGGVVRFDADARSMEYLERLTGD